MSEHHDLPASSAPPTAPAPVPHEQPQVKHETLPAATTPPSSVAATAAAATAAVGATPMNGSASSGETLVCEWGDCKQQLPSAEALYVSFLAGSLTRSADQPRNTSASAMSVGKAPTT